MSEDDLERFPRATGPKTDYEWAFEFHKNCDQLMHQRLAAFTSLQALTLAAYMVLTVARFQEKVPTERIQYFEWGRYAIGFFGIAMALFGWMTTLPMLIRLKYLNEKYLLAYPIYEDYLEGAFKEPFSLFEGSFERLNAIVPRFWQNYRTIIPLWLPLCEVLLWLVLLLGMTLAIVSDDGRANSSAKNL